MLDKIKQLSAEIAGFQAKSLEEVEQFRIKHLSKKGTIAALFDDFKTVPADQKKAMGQELNELKNTALAKINELKELLSNAEEDLSGIDLTMPGDPLKLGTRHPLAIVKIFSCRNCCCTERSDICCLTDWITEESYRNTRLKVSHFNLRLNGWISLHTGNCNKIHIIKCKFRKFRNH